MKITIFGSGYVGLVGGTCFAEMGNHVTLVDVDAAKVEALQRGEIPIYEPGLAELLEDNAHAGRLEFTTDAASAVVGAEACFICVGTPMGPDGHADLRYVKAVARTIGQHLQGFTVVVTKSTVPVGTAELVRAEVTAGLAEQGAAYDFAVASNPEFLKEGAAIEDFMKPDRVVIGVDDARAETVLRDIYGVFMRNGLRLFVMDIPSAEMTKYAANCMLATKISFINEMADICEAVGADVQELARGIGLDGRIGPKFLHPGPGYGGSCFPKDTLALLKTAQDYDAPQLIVESVVSSNDKRKRAMGRRIVHAIGDTARGKKVAILGLTFKPETDDTRDSPAIAIIQALQDAGAKVAAYDPQGTEQAKQVLSNVDYCTSPYDAAENADAVVIVTEWDEFRALDLARIRDKLRDLVLVDLRNIYHRQDVERLGMKYVAVGR